MSKATYRLKKILQAIKDIEFILHDVEFNVTKAIDHAILKPALRMHIIRIAEEFKIKNGKRILRFGTFFFKRFKRTKCRT